MNQDHIDKLKIAIVHDYLHVVGGAEAVANAIYELFPQADIYTASYNKEILEKASVFKDANINEVHLPFLKNIKLSKVDSLLKSNLPLAYPLTNLKNYDLILSSTAHFAKWLNTDNDQIHIS